MPVTSNESFFFFFFFQVRTQRFGTAKELSKAGLVDSSGTLIRVKHVSNFCWLSLKAGANSSSVFLKCGLWGCPQTLEVATCLKLLELPRLLIVWRVTSVSGVSYITLIWRLTARSVMQGERILTESNWTKARAPLGQAFYLTVMLRWWSACSSSISQQLVPLRSRKLPAMTLRLWPAILGSLAVFLNRRKRKGIVPLSWSWNSNMGLFHLKGLGLPKCLGLAEFGHHHIWSVPTLGRNTPWEWLGQRWEVTLLGFLAPENSSALFLLPALV